METAVKELFKAGDAVAKSGRYVCVPCGYEQFFEKGEYEEAEGAFKKFFGRAVTKAAFLLV